MSKPITSYTIPITTDQLENLRKILTASADFEFVEKPYAIFSAKKEKLNVTVYEKGPKVLVQGRLTEEFVKNILEPEILGEARIGREEELDPEMFQPHIGVDESGKGDFFGPLTVAGVFVDQKAAKTLLELGIMDSKRVTSDARIRKRADEIREIPGLDFDVIVFEPESYNHQYHELRNVNRLLAQGHAGIIENLLTRNPDCPRALCDQFDASKTEIQRALKPLGRQIRVDERPRAESDIAVAAASVLAREAFINWMDETEEKLGISIPRGASQKVIETGKKIVRDLGEMSLSQLSKTHFKTSEDILS